MDVSNAGHVPTILSPEQAASQLGHSLAALASRSAPDDSSMIEYGYANWPQLDMVMLTYPAAGSLRITTERLPPDPPELLHAAQSALAGYRLNAMPTNASVDTEEWLTETMTHAYALPARPTPTRVTIDGIHYQPVIVDDGALEAWALDADGVRVTAAGPHGTPAALRWWPQPSLE